MWSGWWHAQATRLNYPIAGAGTSPDAEQTSIEERTAPLGNAFPNRARSSQSITAGGNGSKLRGNVLSSAAKIGRDAAPALGLPTGTQISGLIFDLDGTLYLQGPVRRAMLWRFLRAGVARPVSTWREWRLVHRYRQAQEHLRTCPEPLAAEQFRLACDLSGLLPEQAAKAIAHWMEDAPLDILPRCLRPGVADLLEAAKNRGIRLGLLSDYPATRKLLAMGLDTYFSVVVTAQDDRVGVFKPSPNGLTLALAELGVEPGRAVYIGDRPSVDGETAQRAGVAGVILGQPLGRAGRGWIGVPDVPALRALLVI